MAVKNPFDIAIADIDRQIADLTRSREILMGAAASVTEAPKAEKKTRKPRSKPGLPTSEGL